MGISGLLPFLKKSSTQTNIKQFAGGSVAIDSYCWLHRGVFSCYEKISLGEQTDAYVVYCMKFITMLLQHNIKPILVFDGRYLPAKEITETKRRENREMKRRQAAELIRSGNHRDGKNLLLQSIDVTHEIALELIKACQNSNIDCIVAPYEADAQLAYLNISGIADLVITEDSDLILFGCKKVFFKMDVNGNGTLIEQEKLHLSMDVKSTDFEMDKFLYMCILSGCDYLPSLHGIGLKKAKKFISMNSDCDIHKALINLGTCLNMKSLVVPKEYRDSFIKAFITFKHQLVFCPLQRKQVRLNPPTADVTQDQLCYAGEEIGDCEQALQLAYGNCDPFTFKQLNDFDPDKRQNCNKINPKIDPKMLKNATKHISIWSKKYKPKQNTLYAFIKETVNHERQLCASTSKQSENLQSNFLKQTNSSKKQDCPDYQELNEKFILESYKYEKIQSEGPSENEIHLQDNDLLSSNENEETSPILIRKVNPFAKNKLNQEVSPSLLFKRKSRLKSDHLLHCRKTIIDENIITESKFFSSTNECENVKDNAVDNDNEINSVYNESQVYHTSKKMKMDNGYNTTNYSNQSTEVNNSSDVHFMNIDQLDQNMSMSEDQSIVSENIREENITLQHTDCLGHINKSDNIDNAKLELRPMDSNVNSTINTYNCDMMQSSPSSESEFSVSQNSIEDNTRTLFTPSFKSNTSSGIQRIKTIGMRLSSPKMETKYESPRKRTRQSKQIPLENGQTTLLSMFRFTNKINLSHQK